MCSVCYKHHTSSSKQSNAEAPVPSKDVIETVTPQVAVPSPAPKATEEVMHESPAAAVAGLEVKTENEIETAGAAAAAPEQANPNRCFSCNKRVGFTGFKCRCEFTFCAAHRHSNKHNCTFDYKALGRDAVAKANPAVIKDKVDSRI